LWDLISDDDILSQNLPKRELKDHTMFLFLQKEKEKQSRKKAMKYMQMKLFPEIWKLMTL
jgi:hypothetical protein